MRKTCLHGASSAIFKAAPIPAAVAQSSPVIDVRGEMVITEKKMFP